MEKIIIDLTQEQINTMVHDSCVLFCKHCGCGIPRETCTSLGTCKEHDEYRAAIRTRFMGKKKKEYPKTYEECCKVLDFCGDYFLTTYDADCTVKKEVYGILQQVNSLTRLLICKSAYWKIAGEEMGLGKPWKPDWEDVKSRKYAIVRGEKGKIITGDTTSYATAFAFPTEEMRDAFKENFKSEIESCKELL